MKKILVALPIVALMAGCQTTNNQGALTLSLIHISEPTRPY